MRQARLLLLALGLLGLGVDEAGAQSKYPIMDRVAQKVVQKYQTSSCQQLQAERAQPPSGQREEMKDRAVRLMHEDPQMREAFINQVAAPIANKLFECGMIP
jgi:hypothetical protein